MASNTRLRRAFVLLHRYAGLFMAVFLFVAGLTGSAIAFYTELDRALNPELYRVAGRPGAALSVDELARKVRAAYPHADIEVLTLDREPGESVRVQLSAMQDPATGRPYPLALTEIFLDPVTGRILGGRERGVFHANRASLIPFLYRLHYTLYVPGDWGEWFMGIVALVWLLDCFVGAYLTLPLHGRAAAAATRGRSWWRRWRQAWRLKRRARPTRRNFDLHRAGGLWFLPVLIVMAFTSVYFNLTTQVFDPVVSLFGRLTPSPSETLPRLPHAAQPPRISFAAALAAAHAHLSTASSHMVPYYMGQADGAPGIYKVVFIDPHRGDVAWHFHYETLYIDGATGEWLQSVGHHAGTPADRFALWQYPLHTGQILGFWGRAFIALIGLIVALLSVTGVVLWMKKRRAEIHARRNARSARLATSSLVARGAVGSDLTP